MPSKRELRGPKVWSRIATLSTEGIGVMRRYVVASLMLTLLMMVAAPASADGPRFQFTFDFELEAVNPCTGLDHDLAGTVTVTAHEFDTILHHESALFTGDFATDDGYSGRGLLHITELSGETGLAKTQTVTHFFLTNVDGQRIMTHMVFHLNEVDSSPIAVVDLESSRCVGRPG